jgi:hypothetical protein
VCVRACARARARACVYIYIYMRIDVTQQRLAIARHMFSVRPARAPMDQMVYRKSSVTSGARPLRCLRNWDVLRYIYDFVHTEGYGRAGCHVRFRGVNEWGHVIETGHLITFPSSWVTAGGSSNFESYHHVVRAMFVKFTSYRNQNVSS